MLAAGYLHPRLFSMNEPFYDPNDLNDPELLGGQPPAGYTRIEKVGKKYVGTGPKKPAKKGPGRGASPWTTLMTWVVGLGLPVLLIYFMVQKLFIEKTVVSSDPYPPVKYEEAQLAELKTLGQEVAQELREGKTDLLQRRVVWPEVIYRVGQKMKLTTGQQVTVRDTIHAKNESDVPGLFRQVLGNDSQRTPAQLVRIAERDGYPTVIVRTMPTDVRVLYFEMLTVPVDGKLKIVDIYDWNRGMFAADAVRREVLLEIRTDEAANLPWRAIYGEKLSVEQILAIKVLLNNDILDRSQVLDDIAVLPAEVRDSSEVFSMSLKAYQKLLEGTASPKQLEPCKALLAAPPASLASGSLVTGMMLAEVEARMGNADAVEPAVLQAHGQIKDAYLKVLLGQRRLEKGDLAGAQQMADAAAKEDRTLPELAPLRAQLNDKRPGH